MIHFLRILVWYRWRTLVNTLRGGFRRDPLERASRLLFLVIVVFTVVLSLTVAVGLGIFAWVAGLGIGEGRIEPEPPLLLLRALVFLLLAVLVLAPLGRSLQGPSSGSSRFALLPIPISIQHRAQLLAGLFDPWTLPGLPLVLFFPAGLAFAGRGIAAGAATLAACAVLLVAATLGSLSSLLVQWLLRRRGRAEVIGLLLLGILSMASLVPSFMDQKPDDARSKGDFGLQELEGALAGFAYFLPSELYGRAVRSGIEVNLTESLATSGALLALGAALFPLSRRLHRHLLDSPEEGARRRGAASGFFWRWPGLSIQAAAVASTQIRTVLRSLRGRFALYFTAPLVALLGTILRSLHGGVFWRTYIDHNGYLLVTGATFVAVTSTLPLVGNLFAVDRTGLTREFLAPLAGRDLLLGKLAGGAVLFLGTLTLGLAGISLALVGHSDKPPGGWLLLMLVGLSGGVASYLSLAPVLALLSITLPRAADLNRLGKAGNPHPAASLLASLAAMLTCAACSVVLALAYSVLARPVSALIAFGAWSALAAVLNRVLLPPLSAMLARRRDNLALLAEAR